MNPFLMNALLAVINAVPLEKVFAAIVHTFIKDKNGQPDPGKVKAFRKISKCAAVTADLLNPDESPELDATRAKAIEAWADGKPTPEEAKSTLGV